MKIVEQKFEILGVPDGNEILKAIEVSGRTCYKSEDRITPDSAKEFVAMLIERGHHAMLEHQIFSARITCDRGVSHEIVRHRIAAYAQESTRYCNYGKDKFGSEITFIEPPHLNEIQRAHWYNACRCAETLYFEMLDSDCAPEIARSVLPTCVKTEIVITMNIRQWRHFFHIRALNKYAHPQMREVAMAGLVECYAHFPVIFDDLVDDLPIAK